MPTHPCFFEHVPVLSQALWLLHVSCSWPIESQLSQNQAFWPKNQSFCQITNHQAYWLTCHGKQHVMASNICIHMPCYIYLWISSIQALLAKISCFLHVGATGSNIACIVQTIAMLPQSVLRAVDTVLQSKDGVMKKRGQIEETLVSAKLAYKQAFPPELFIVHPL